MLLFLGNLIEQLFGQTARTVVHAAEAKLRRDTVGRVETQISGNQAEMQQRALRAVNQVGVPDRDRGRSS
ncbi:MAG: hypothetical protein JW797_19050 [Bradymonadales bacterium]|nr:hypothetical protein [Bradymonadales bacterium]